MKKHLHQQLWATWSQDFSSTPQWPLDLDIYVYFWLVKIILNVCSFDVKKGKNRDQMTMNSKKSGFQCLNIILLIQSKMSDKKQKKKKEGKNCI